MVSLVLLMRFSECGTERQITTAFFFFFFSSPISLLISSLELGGLFHLRQYAHVSPLCRNGIRVNEQSII